MAHRRIGGVYVICGPQNKVYVGSSVNILKRWDNHRRSLIDGKHHALHLQRAWVKHGSHAFRFVIIEQSTSLLLTELEQKWIDLLDAANHTYGYNSSPFAGNSGRRGLGWTTEQREMLSRAHKGIASTKDQIEKTRLRQLGSRSHFAKLTETAVLEILTALAQGSKQKVLAVKYGVSRGTLSLIARRRTWTHVEVNAQSPQERKR